MKIELRTKLQHGIKAHRRIVASGKPSRVTYGSLAAHAYQAAIAEAPSSVCMDSGDVPSWIETRAAELLASYLDEGK